MDFNLHIKNIGKLADEKIRIGQFTVFAGPNNTGKSFVSKLLYSFFNAMKKNPAEVHINNLLAPSYKALGMLESWADETDELLSQLRNEVEEIHDLVAQSPVGDIDALNGIIPTLNEKVENTITIFSQVRSSFDLLAEKYEEAEEDISSALVDEMERSLENLEEKITTLDAMNFIARGMRYEIKENLIHNFQVTALSELKGRANSSSDVGIADFAKLGFENKNIKFNIKRTFLRELQRFSQVIYLESPVYWKLKDAFERSRGQWFSFLRGRRERVSDIPRYFYDLIDELKGQYVGDMDFPDLHEKLTGKEILGGKIAISETGDLSFQENGHSCSLPLTALGVANLGILALLIERKVLDKGTFLFIDEPEAHLHPAWQVVMAEALFELAKGGVNVVIATHSAEILKWLEVHVKKNPDDESLIALNQFSSDGVKANDEDFAEQIAAIKQELTKPFSKLYIQGM